MNIKGNAEGRKEAVSNLGKRAWILEPRFVYSACLSGKNQECEEDRAALNFCYFLFKQKVRKVPRRQAHAQADCLPAASRIRLPLIFHTSQCYMSTKNIPFAVTPPTLTFASQNTSMTKKILANDGIDATGKKMLEQAGYTVVTEKVAQEKLAAEINAQGYTALTVRSATQVRKDLIDACPQLKVIGRGGVGMDNIDVEYARSKGIAVINTPAASSNSVAELVLAHAFGVARFLYDSNRQMPQGGKFEELKKKYSKGVELRGKTFGIIGIGRIGQSVARMALGLGMKVVCHDPFVKEATIEISIEGANTIKVTLKSVSPEEVYAKSDYITFHVPGGELVGEKELSLMKNGVVLINTARGGVINEEALLAALDSAKVAHACLDVFKNEPNPSEKILKHPKISLTPHIGAATNEAQERIGVELAEKMIEALAK
jgi:D-3-phosphoglycerate dehydrogenase